MDHAGVQEWLDRYVAAWRANEREPIEALFTEDAIYSWRPGGTADSTATGRDAIVDGWLKEQDDPDSWEASYEVYAVDGERAVATGVSRYAATSEEKEQTYHNVFLLRFAPDGRCSEFTELYMLQD